MISEMPDAVYGLIAVVVGIGMIFVANKTILADLFDEDDEFFDFVMKQFFRFVAFALGFGWPIVLPIAALFGSMYAWWYYTAGPGRAAAKVQDQQF